MWIQQNSWYEQKKIKQNIKKYVNARLNNISENPIARRANQPLHSVCLKWKLPWSRRKAKNKRNT